MVQIIRMIWIDSGDSDRFGSIRGSVVQRRYRPRDSQDYNDSDDSEHSNASDEE